MEAGSVGWDEGLFDILNLMFVCLFYTKGNIIGKDEVMNAETLPAVVMPNHDGFIPDPRPDVFNYD